MLCNKKTSNSGKETPKSIRLGNKRLTNMSHQMAISKLHVLNSKAHFLLTLSLWRRANDSKTDSVGEFDFRRDVPLY